LRILIATDVPRQKEAGTAGVVLNHVSELQKRGHDVECWFFEDVVDPNVTAARFASLLFAIRVARRIIATPEKYDVVNLHGPSGCAYGMWRRAFGSRGAPPYVFTIQGIIERYAHVMRREHRKGRAWHFGWKNRLWHRMYHRTLFTCAIRTADYGIASNREAWTYPELVHDRDPGRIWYIPNGVEESFFLTREYHQKTPLRLLYVGTWLDRKGIYYLVDAFGELLRRKLPMELTVAGCLSSEQQVKACFPAEFQGRVCVLPFVKREAMPSVYAGHDIFVFPSLMEGMPLSLLEAMASGMPVVTTYNSGMADVVEDGFNGLTVLDADAESLANAVDRLSRSLELRKQLGEEAGRTMRRYTWERVVRQVERVLLLAVRQEARK
jgi:glycosyltransferase involved in cell wall biosynthesis